MVYTESMKIYSEPVAVVDVPSLISGVLETLRFWRDAHTHPETWAKNWLVDDDINLDYIELSNQYFFVDMDRFKLELAKLATADLPPFYCCECGGEGDEPECCGEPCSSQAPEDYVGCMDFSTIPYAHILEVMKEYAFPIYEAGVSPVIEGVLEEVEYYITKIEGAEDNYDRLSAAIEALSLAHTNGDIFGDYLGRGMYNIEWSDILGMRERGIISFFSPEEVKEYLSS